MISATTQTQQVAAVSEQSCDNRRKTNKELEKVKDIRINSAAYRAVSRNRV